MRTATRPVSVLVFFVVSAACFGIPAPKAMYELGLTSAQRALRFESGYRILFFREKLFRQHRPEFDSLDSGELSELIAANASFLTRLQMGWEGILMEVTVPPTATRTIYHRPEYLRAATFPLLPLADLGNPLESFLDGPPIEAKNTGLSPEAEMKRNLFHDFARVMRGETTKLKFPNWNELKVVAPLLQAEIEAAIADLQTEIFEHPNDPWLARTLQLQKLELTIVRSFQTGVRELEETGAVRSETENIFLDALRRSDYRNGLGPARTVLKEALLEEVLLEIYSVLNEVWGTNLEVVPNYMGVVLPVNILTGGGKKNPQREPAAVDVRGAHWRAKLRPGQKVPRFFLPLDIVSSVFAGTEQFDVSGALVDLETMQAKGPGIGPELSYRPHQILERWAKNAVPAALAGDVTAIPRCFERARRSVDKEKLRAWALRHRPPVNREYDVFPRAYRLARVVSEQRRASSEQSQRLNRYIRSLRAKGARDQVETLLAVVAPFAEKVVDEVWLWEVRALDEALKDRSRQLAAGEPKVPEVRWDSSVLASIVVSQLGSRGAGLADWRTRRLRELFLRDPGLAAGLLREAVPEELRKTALLLGISVAHMDPSTWLYAEVGDAISSILYLHFAFTANQEPVFPSAFAIDGKIQPRRIQNLFGNDKKFFIAGLIAAQKIAGLDQLDPRVIQFLFPAAMENYAIATLVALGPDDPRFHRCAVELAAVMPADLVKKLIEALGP